LNRAPEEESDLTFDLMIFISKLSNFKAIVVKV